MGFSILPVLPVLFTGIVVVSIIFMLSKNHNAENVETDSNSTDTYMSLGMVLGMCLGTELGISGIIPLGYGASFGMLIGMIIGLFIKKA